VPTPRHYLKSENKKIIEQQKPKQVYYVWNYLEWGGAQVYFLGIASRIKDRTRVKFIFPRETDRQFISFCENLNIEYDFLDVKADLKSAPTLKRKIQRHLNKITTEWKTLKYLSEVDFKDSILHIDLSPWQSLLALTKLCLNGEVFMTMHNALPQTANWRKRLWKLKFSVITKFNNFHIFASNKDAKESLKPFVPDDFFSKVKVTYTNVNPDEIDEALKSQFDRNQQLEKFKLPVDKTLIFCLGQFIDRKGRWIFLESAKKVCKENKNCHFVWITNSNLSVDEVKKIESYDLKEKFSLIKSEDVGINHLDLIKFLRLADIFTLPSFVEGLPISLLEAMSLGIPSISTNVYAIPEAVKDNETGLLIEPGNSDALAEAILKINNDELFREKIGKAGREWVLQKFNEKIVAEIAFQSYTEALNR